MQKIRPCFYYVYLSEFSPFKLLPSLFFFLLFFRALWDHPQVCLIKCGTNGSALQPSLLIRLGQTTGGCGSAHWIASLLLANVFSMLLDFELHWSANVLYGTVSSLGVKPSSVRWHNDWTVPVPWGVERDVTLKLFACNEWWHCPEGNMQLVLLLSADLHGFLLWLKLGTDARKAKVRTCAPLLWKEQGTVNKSLAFLLFKRPPVWQNVYGYI